MASKRLTDIQKAPSVFLDNLIHVVNTGITIDDPSGTSYKATLQQVYDSFNITEGNRWYIPYGETVTINTDYQYFFYGDIVVGGTLNLDPNSQLVVLNGDILLSGGTINNVGATIYNIDLPLFDTKVSGMTYSGDVLTIYQNDGSNYSVNVVTSTDITITGGTYDPITGVATFYNNNGGNFPVSGFLTGYTDINVSSLDYVGNILVLNQTNGTSFSANTPMFSGGTVTGPTNFTNGLTATSINIGSLQVPRKFIETDSFNGSELKTITHNLGTEDIVIQIWDSSKNLIGGGNITINDLNSVDITLATTDTYKIIIIG